MHACIDEYYNGSDGGRLHHELLLEFAVNAYGCAIVYRQMSYGQSWPDGEWYLTRPIVSNIVPCVSDPVEQYFSMLSMLMTNLTALGKPFNIESCPRASQMVDTIQEFLSDPATGALGVLGVEQS